MARYQPCSNNNNNNNNNTFIPLAFETFGAINSKGVVFLNELGHRLAVSIGDTRETSFLFQRPSLTIQRFNAICFSGSFALNNADNDSQPLSAFVCRLGF